MPGNVVLFEQLMYLSLAAAVGNGVVLDRALTPEQLRFGMGFVIAVQAITLLLYVLFIWLVARRRKNWARWVMVIFFVIELPSDYFLVSAEFRRNVFSGSFTSAQIVLELAAYYFIFTGDAREWFRARYQ